KSEEGQRLSRFSHQWADGRFTLLDFTLECFDGQLIEVRVRIGMVSQVQSRPHPYTQDGTAFLHIRSFADPSFIDEANCRGVVPLQRGDHGLVDGSNVWSREGLILVRVPCPGRREIVERQRHQARLGWTKSTCKSGNRDENRCQQHRPPRSSLASSSSSRP